MIPERITIETYNAQLARRYLEDGIKRLFMDVFGQQWVIKSVVSDKQLGEPMRWTIVLEGIIVNGGPKSDETETAAA